jgi:ferric-dicitrate binding protein FerR (iron transport regulator)
VTVGDNQAATGTITADDRAPRPGRSVGVIPVRGTVRIRLPGGRFRVLLESDLLPNGTTIDTLRGRVTLIAATNQSGSESKADFYDGVFKLRQSKGSRPITTLTLTDRLTCPRAGTAIAAAKKRKRRLWGDGSGRFRTKGKHSAATVVGTKWLVEDRCTSTLTRVVRGRVSVRDFVKKKTIIVRRGKRYIARARP